MFTWLILRASASIPQAKQYVLPQLKLQCLAERENQSGFIIVDAAVTEWSRKLQGMLLVSVMSQDELLIKLIKFSCSVDSSDAMQEFVYAPMQTPEDPLRRQRLRVEVCSAVRCCCRRRCRCLAHSTTIPR